MPKIHHVGIISSDLKKSMGFYVKNFGFEFGWEFFADSSIMKEIFGIASPAKVFSLKLNDFILELFNFENLDTNDIKMGKITHFAISFDDRLKKFEELKKNGIPFIEYKKQNGDLVYFVKDPDNNLVEIK